MSIRIIEISFAIFGVLGDSESFLNGNIDSDQKINVKEELESEQDRFKKALNLCTSLQNFKGKTFIHHNLM